jgi:Tfp pilus assembly protein PilF
MLPQVHIEFFSNLGQQALQHGQPGQARLAFERGAQYLRKQNDPARYQNELKKFEEQLARANTMVLDKTQPADAQASELNQGLESLESEEDWKKKNIYD